MKKHIFKLTNFNLEEKKEKHAKKNDKIQKLFIYFLEFLLNYMKIEINIKETSINEGKGKL